jgi:predicted MFS family arabinose efflux permease
LANLSLHPAFAQEVFVTAISNINTPLKGTVALMVAHCAGMLDLVALPVWVGTLIQHYQFDPQQAGSLATLFLLGAVVASVVLASGFNRLPRRLVSACGFLLSALCFAGVSTLADFTLMAVLHVIAGVSAGAALSVTHGTIARSANPHRMFAIVGCALGIFAVLFLGMTPKLVASNGGAALFVVFAIVMAVAALVSALAFPAGDEVASADGVVNDPGLKHDSALKIPAEVWYGIVGIACMGLVQSMVFSFLERVGHDRGFGLTAITGVLIALGVVNLLPAALAGFLEKRLSVRSVMFAGPIIQALLALTIMSSGFFPAYAAAASVFAAVMIFTHTFVFGLLARLDVSGRAMAATPAMLMVGAAIGPILGGTLVKMAGYTSLGLAAVVIGAVSVLCFVRIHKDRQAAVAEGLV